MAFSLKEVKFSEVIMVLSSYHMLKYCYTVRSYFMDNRLAPWLGCKCLSVRDHECSLFYVMLPVILLLALLFALERHVCQLI